MSNSYVGAITVVILKSKNSDENPLQTHNFFGAEKTFFNKLIISKLRTLMFFLLDSLTVTLACNLNLHMFPHDVQTCSVMLESCK